MLTAQLVPDPFFLAKLFFEKPLHTYNPVLFAGILLGRPLAMGFVTMMPFMPVLDFRTPIIKGEA
jgi:hypothetical protein